MTFVPENEMGVIVYFAQKIALIDNVSFVSVRIEYPDAMLLIDGKEYLTEFEYLSSNFLLHKHDPRKCDLIICWADDIKHKNKLPIYWGGNSMAGQIIYSEKCVCGATINLAENYSFIAVAKLDSQFQRWQARHSNCVLLFVDIQQTRLTQLKAQNQKLIGGNDEIL